MSAWEQVFQKIGHLSHIACPLNADGPNWFKSAACVILTRKIWKEWALTRRWSSKHLSFVVVPMRWCLQSAATRSRQVLFPTQPVAMVLWQRMSKLFNTWCILVSQSPTQFARFPGPKMTQGWHVSLAARATPSWSKSAACVILTRKIWKAWALTRRSLCIFLLLWCWCVDACNRRQLVLDKFCFQHNHLPHTGIPMLMAISPRVQWSLASKPQVEPSYNRSFMW